MDKHHIDALVDRFLGWQVPATECADPCASMPNYPHPRSGTNFFSADGARQMFEYLFNFVPAPADQPDWMPRASAHLTAEGTHRFGSTGQLWKVVTVNDSKVWERIHNPTPEQCAQADNPR
jgi:hypothetical protein